MTWPKGETQLRNVTKTFIEKWIEDQSGPNSDRPQAAFELGQLLNLAMKSCVPPVDSGERLQVIAAAVSPYWDVTYHWDEVSRTVEFDYTPKRAGK